MLSPHQALRDHSCSRHVTQPPVLSLNRGFSAPIKLVANLTRRRPASARRARQRSVQPLAGVADAGDCALLVATSALIRAGNDPGRIDEDCSTALAAILDDETLEPAFMALALAMPSEADIAREIGRDVDPDANPFGARRICARSIGEHLGGALQAIPTGEMKIAAPYSPDAASAGRRSLRNHCARPAGRDRRRGRDRSARARNIVPPTT